jgi:hypothetical protein
VPLSSRPYRPSKKAPFVAYSNVVVMVMAATIISAGQGRFSWLWIFPFLATAATVYGHRRERVAKNVVQGSLWALAQSACALGLVLIALPAKYTSVRALDTEGT